MTRDRPATAAERAMMGKRLIRLADLDHRHHGRTIQVAGLEGTLTGVVPLGDRVQLAIVVGGARVWSDWLDADDSAEVWK